MIIAVSDLEIKIKKNTVTFYNFGLIKQIPNNNLQSCLSNQKLVLKFWIF